MWKPTCSRFCNTSRCLPSQQMMTKMDFVPRVFCYFSQAQASSLYRRLWLTESPTDYWVSRYQSINRWSVTLTWFTAVGKMTFSCSLKSRNIASQARGIIPGFKDWGITHFWLRMKRKTGMRCIATTTVPTRLWPWWYRKRLSGCIEGHSKCNCHPYKARQRDYCKRHW